MKHYPAQYAHQQVQNKQMAFFDNPYFSSDQ